MKNNRDERDGVALVRQIVSRELPPGALLPDVEVDLVKTDLIDSMGWVGILSGLEEATGVSNFGSSWPEGQPQSIRSLAEALRAACETPRRESATSPESRTSGAIARAISVRGWGYALGSLRVEAAQIEEEYGLPAGTIRDRAGIGSVCRADESENEASLAQRAANLALESAGLDAGKLDLLVCTSTTFLELPSLGAVLHNRLLLEQPCAVLDVGGACVGLVNALAAAKGLLATLGGRAALVVGSEVHSRRFASSQGPGEFRGLFGDGACAFVLTTFDGLHGDVYPQVGKFVFGCSGSMSSSLRLALRHKGELEVTFSGETLAHGAVTTLSQVISRLEDLSGVARSEVECFAFHEPNPRLVEILAQKAEISHERIATNSKTLGNLGSVSCGVALCEAFNRCHASPREAVHPTIFMAAVGPGLLWGGTYFR